MGLSAARYLSLKGQKGGAKSQKQHTKASFLKMGDSKACLSTDHNDDVEGKETKSRRGDLSEKYPWEVEEWGPEHI